MDEQPAVSAALLSARELQIAALVAMGCPNKLIVHKLNISEWTVTSNLRRIFSKLGVETRAATTYRCAQLIGKFEGKVRYRTLSRNAVRVLLAAFVWFFDPMAAAPFKPRRKFFRPRS